MYLTTSSLLDMQIIILINIIIITILNQVKAACCPLFSSKRLIAAGQAIAAHGLFVTDQILSYSRSSWVCIKLYLCVSVSCRKKQTHLIICYTHFMYKLRLSLLLTSNWHDIVGWKIERWRVNLIYVYLIKLMNMSCCIIVQSVFGGLNLFAFLGRIKNIPHKYTKIKCPVYNYPLEFWRNTYVNFNM